MSKRQKIKSILLGLLTTVCVIYMVLSPQKGYPFMIFIVSISFLYSAIKKLLYYFTMARWTIDGITILCKGFIELDLAWFIFSLQNMPKYYVALYLMGGLLFSAVVDILMAFESKHLNAASWKYKFLQGISSILLSIVCFIYMHSIKVIVYVFCLGLIQSAAIRIVKAFKKKEVIYIQ